MEKIISLILIIVLIILFVIIINLQHQLKVLKHSNKKLVEFNDIYGSFLDEYKVYKHNIKNKLLAIKTFGDEKVINLINDLLEEDTSLVIKNNNVYDLPSGIKGLVAEKLYNKDYEVIIDNKIKKDPFIKLPTKTINSIFECLGIALDNAIEASKDTKDPLITIDLYENKKSFFIKIGNNFDNNIDLDKLGEKYYSTKKQGRGLGLFSIIKNKEIAEKIEIINNIYYITLEIQKYVE